MTLSGYIRKLFGQLPKLSFISLSLIDAKRQIMRMDVLNEDTNATEQYYAYSYRLHTWFDKNGEHCSNRSGAFSYDSLNEVLCMLYRHEIFRLEAESRAKKIAEAEKLRNKPLCEKCSGSGHVKVEVQYVMNVLHEPTACPICNGSGYVEE